MVKSSIPITAEAVDSTESYAFAFDGDRAAFFRIIVRNILLTVVTVGIYRFWAKTRLRRYLWAKTRLQDEPFEYVGRGAELFVGFLIVLSILFPLGLIYALFSTLVVSTEGSVRELFDLLSTLVFVFLLGVATFRAQRYRLSRTQWRGIRGRLGGSSLAYGLRYLVWILLVLLTLGLAYPGYSIALTRYMTRHTWFGSGRFGFHGSGWALFFPWLGVLFFWGVLLGSASVLTYMAYDTVFAENEASTFFGLPAPAVTLSLVFLWIINGWFCVGVFIQYKVTEFRYIFSCTNLDAARFDLKLNGNRIFQFSLRYVAIVFVALIPIIVLPALAAVLAEDFSMEDTVTVYAVLAVLFFTFVLPPLYYVYFLFDLLKAMFKSLAMTNAQVVDTIKQAEDQGLKFGEGLADAFDVGGI